MVSTGQQKGSRTVTPDQSLMTVYCSHNLELTAMERRNIRYLGKRTTIQLDSYIWECLDIVLSLENITISLLCAELESRRRHLKLTQSLRLFALIYFKSWASHQDQNNLLLSHYLAEPEADSQFNCFLFSLSQFSDYAEQESQPEIHRLPQHGSEHNAGPHQH